MAGEIFSISFLLVVLVLVGMSLGALLLKVQGNEE
jgi:hypothetical protein